MNRSSPKRFETHNKTKLSDYVYKIASGGKQARKFTEITQYLLTYIQRTYSEGIGWTDIIWFKWYHAKEKKSTNEDQDLKVQEYED